jgi:uncharacterized membrane protein
MGALCACLYFIMKKISVRFLVQAALIAAIYCVLVILATLTPYGALNFGPVQMRISEALTILPFFTLAASPGLFVGCLLSNIIGVASGVSFGAIDIVLGSLATLAAAFCSYALRKNKWLVALPPVVINAVVVGLELSYFLPQQPWWVYMLSVGAGQLIACYGLGMLLLLSLDKHKGIFKQ